MDAARSAVPATPAVTAGSVVAEERAAAVLGALQGRSLFTRRHGLVGRRRPPLLGPRRYAHLWPFANAWSAVGAAASLSALAEAAAPTLSALCSGAAAYRHRPQDAGPGGFDSAVVAPLGPGGDRYFDDNAWLGLAAARHYELTADPGALDLAVEAWRFAASGWASEPTDAVPGGVLWREAAAARARHTCATAPAAGLAVLVFVHTGERAALDWARRAYDWAVEAVRSPAGLYYDRIGPDGVLDRSLWSYNQGAMIGAGVLLARATGDQGYLAQAEETAAAASRLFDADLLGRQGAAFAAIYLRNLALLAAARPAPAPDVPADARAPAGWRALAAAYGDKMWERRRRRSGLWGDSARPLNATAPLLEVYALAAGAAPAP